MHELSICQALVSQVLTLAQERAASSVRQVRIGVGPLSGVEWQLLQSAYPLACAGTRAEGSRLEIEHTELRVRCRSCGIDSVVAPNHLTCTACGDWRTALISGDELLLLSVELEIADQKEELARV
jgi:hydrogenase nickel incorporation protein HypA/HybF